MAHRARSGGRAGAGAHEHLVAASLFALLVLVYLWPALVQGHLLAPTSVLYRYAPWRGTAPSGVGHYLNPLLDDVPLSYYPWDVLARRLLHAGTFPAWNPDAFGGTPFFANPEVAWLSPFSLPLWILPLTSGLAVAAALKLWTAGFGAYLLARELRLSFWPGIVAGASFALCAFDVVWLSHGVQVSVAVLLPWTIWLVERIVRRGRAGDGLALAAVVALVLTGGHPGTQLHVLAAALLYALVRAGLVRDATRRERLLRLATVAGATVLGVLITAAALLPAQRAAAGTIGALARENGAAVLPGSILPTSVLRAALFPDWWGRPSELHALTGPANYNERALYAGAVALVLAVVALLRGRGWRRMAPFALLGAIGLAVPFDVPVIRDAVVHAPLFDRVQDQRMLLWFLFAVALLAGFGLQALLEAPRREWRGWLAIGAALAVGLAAGASVRGAAPSLGSFLRRSAEMGPEALALASVGWWLVFVIGLAAVLLLAPRGGGRVWSLGLLVALLAALDLLHFAHGYQPIGPAARAIPPRTAAVAYLQRHDGGARFAGVDSTLANDWSTVYGLRDVRGYDAPQPSTRFYDLWRTIAPEQVSWLPFSIHTLGPQALRVLGMLGARTIVVPPGTGVPSPLLAPVYRGRDATILANRLAVPRALVARQVRVADGEPAELGAIVEARFDPRRDVVVRSDELGTRALASGGGAVRVVAERNARVTLRARLPRRGLVLLDDAWSPGWSVMVDGRPTRALQADMVLRGVVVPAGTHEVVWSYRVPGLRLGAALSAVGLLAWLAWAALLLRARRADRRRPIAAR
jgi:hypothetical protein